MSSSYVSGRDKVGKAKIPLARPALVKESDKYGEIIAVVYEQMKRK